MERVFAMTMFKAWLVASEALKHSDSTLSGLSLCEQIVGTVERRLNEETNFYAQFERAKDEMKRADNETRGKRLVERDASKVLRKNVAAQKTITKKGRVKVPATSRPATVTDPLKQLIAKQTGLHRLQVTHAVGLILCGATKFIQNELSKRYGGCIRRSNGTGRATFTER